MADDDRALSALRELAEALDAPSDDEALSRALPLVGRVLRREGPGVSAPSLGETEPAFGLRFDLWPRSAGSGDGGGS